MSKILTPEQVAKMRDDYTDEPEISGCNDDPDCMHCDVLRVVAAYEALSADLQGTIADLAEVTAERDALKDELAVTNQILVDRERVLDAVPPCPVHGRCVPYAVEWIEEQIRSESSIVCPCGDEFPDATSLYAHVLVVHAHVVVFDRKESRP